MLLEIAELPYEMVRVDISIAIGFEMLSGRKCQRATADECPLMIACDDVPLSQPGDLLQ